MRSLSLVIRVMRRGLFAAGLALAPVVCRAAHDAPVSPDAEPGVWSLLQVLDRVSGRLILSGQQEIGWDAARVEEDIDYVHATTGKYPVVRGLDFGDYTYAAGRPLFATERAIDWARRGGVVTFSCHMAMRIGSPEGRPQFYVPTLTRQGTDFDIRQAVIEGTPENRELIEKMDIVAAQLQRLQEAGVTVIWRPFHECSGGWFWWGAHGPKPFKKAWRMMFDRFTQKFHLTNLIWCYTPTDTAEKMEQWYPGDDVVDLIGLDFYPKVWTLAGESARRHPAFSDDYRKARAFKLGKKTVVMSENGAIPDPAKLFGSGAGWSYFLTWNGFEKDPSQNSADFLRQVYGDPRVVTLDTYPAVYAANALAIMEQPQSATLEAGTPLTLTVKVAAPGAVTYQWYKDTVAVPGATAATLRIPNATRDDAGRYRVEVKTVFETITSEPATVAVEPH